MRLPLQRLEKVLGSTPNSSPIFGSPSRQPPEYGRGVLGKTPNFSAAWNSIVITHAHFTDPSFASQLLMEEEFVGTKLLSEDLLDGLSIEQIGVLYEYTLAKEDYAKRKATGAYFTPDDIATYLAQQALQFPDGTWIDPCCGVGNLAHHFISQSNDKVKALSQLTLMDIDARALLIARTLLAIHFAPDLQVWKQIKAVNQDFLDYSLTEDYVLMNPPYARAEADKRFRSWQARDLYAYFIEKATEAKGAVIIVPQSFTNASKFQGLRQVLLDSYKGGRIYAFDNVPNCIFYGVKFGSPNTNSRNSTRAAILVVGNEPTWQITPLLRWKSSERAQMLTKLDSFLGEQDLTAKYFAKVAPPLLGLFQELASRPRLKDSLSPKETEYKLNVATSFRYFIPTVKRELNRTSSADLYFLSAQERDKWYLVLNSSILYFWWRALDGGMTLSHRVLLDCPLPATADWDSALVRKLEESEQQNLVTKLNAGKLIESVKHPLSLIAELNQKLAPEYAAALIAEHGNSNIH